VSGRRLRQMAALLAVAAMAPFAGLATAQDAGVVPLCAPGGTMIELDGSVSAEDAKTPRGMQNPFTQDAIELWEELLLAGHKITAVSGSDAKVGRDYGMNATAVFARELSRAALVDAVRSSHAYVRTRGVHDSPTLAMTAVTPDGQEGIFGDTLHADSAEVTVTVTGAANQLLRIYRDGVLADLRPITGDELTYTFTATRDAGSGPLDTFWRVETADDVSLTTIGNPIFLRAP
jgi:hypothetical protein